MLILCNETAALMNCADTEISHCASIVLVVLARITSRTASGMASVLDQQDALQGEQEMVHRAT